jgi:diguanylate cyclase (GGDEF)-like protein
LVARRRPPPLPSDHCFNRRVALPVAGLIAVAMLAVVAFVGYSAQRQARDAQEQSVRATGSTLATKVSEVARTAQDYAWWNDAVRRLDLDPEIDPDWADGNIGGYIHETFGYDASFVIGRDDTTRYAMIDGVQHNLDALAFAPDLAPLLGPARAIAPDQAGAVAAFVELAGTIAIVGLSPITPETSHPIETPAGPRPVLVYVQRLDGALLDPIAEALGLSDLRVVPAGEPALLPLARFDGEDLGGLAWQPPPLGQAFIRDILPSLVLAFVLIAGCAWLVLKHARSAARAIEASELRFRDVAEASADWIWESDGEGRLSFLSERFAAVMDLAPATFLARPLGDLLEGDADVDGGGGRDRLLGAIEERRAFRDLLCATRHGSGRSCILRFAGRPARGPGGAFTGYRGTASDVTAQIDAERRARHLALHDLVTDLPNRELLRRRLEQALAGRRRRGGIVAVLLLDLDRFKLVNDTLGHAAGDRLIQQCARRLEACLRETDTVARLGGDEFAIVQADVAAAGEVQRLCRRLLDALSEPFDLDGHEVVISASIGATLAPRDADSPDLLLRHADVALYRAKDAGRNTVRFFEPTMDRRLQARREVECDLRSALARDELEIHYLLQVAVRDLRPVGVEALARWHHPRRGWLGADQFIPIAEETGLIVPLGEQILRTACATLAPWPGLRLSVNVSAVQFRRGDLVALVEDALRTSGLEAARLQLEITEAALHGDAAATLAKLGTLRQMGVGVAMDDFGTGYSSLSYLQRFPFDVLKIDRTFVAALGPGAGGTAAIVRAVIGLGRALGIRTCAEGVETAEQLAFLLAEGCDEAQGHHFARPAPAAALTQLLAAAGREPAMPG